MEKSWGPYSDPKNRLLCLWAAWNSILTWVLIERANMTFIKVPPNIAMTRRCTIRIAKYILVLRLKYCSHSLSVQTASKTFKGCVYFKKGWKSNGKWYEWCEQILLRLLLAKIYQKTCVLHHRVYLVNIGSVVFYYLQCQREIIFLESRHFLTGTTYFILYVCGLQYFTILVICLLTGTFHAYNVV